MKAMFVPLVAIALGTGCTSVAGGTIEYSHIAV